VLRRGWGQFTAEIVTISDFDSDETERSDARTVGDFNEILDLDDEDAETGLPHARERPN